MLLAIDVSFGFCRVLGYFQLFLVYLKIIMWILNKIYVIWTFCCTEYNEFMKAYQWFYWTANLQLWEKSQPVSGPQTMFMLTFNFATVCGLFEWKWNCRFLLFVYNCCRWWSNYQERNVVISFTGLNPPLFLTCPKLGHEFPTPYVVFCFYFLFLAVIWYQLAVSYFYRYTLFNSTFLGLYRGPRVSMS